MNTWEKVGDVDVDAGLIWVGDPCYVMGSDSSHGPKTWDDFWPKTCAPGVNAQVSAPLGDGVGFAIQSGWGDGTYSVYVQRKEGRIAAVKVEFL